jgi:SpoIID/LytB domain protein
MAAEGSSAAKILSHYFTGTKLNAVTDNVILRVNLANRASSVRLSSAALETGGGDFRVTLGGRTLTGTPASIVTLQRTDAGIQASCTGCTGTVTSASGTSASVTWEGTRALTGKATLLDVAGPGEKLGDASGRYRSGSLTVLPSSGATGVEAVAHVRLHDEYLDYITEMPWSWPAAALQAQAIAARGYAVSKYAAGVRSVCACHVYDGQSDQVFAGYPSGTNLSYHKYWAAAVRATAPSSTTGRVLHYDGKVISAFYSSSTGGRTQNNEDVWGGTALPYLRSVKDPWSLQAPNPNAHWREERTQKQVAAAFGLPDVVRLDLSSRNASGAVRTAVAYSSAGRTASLTGAQLRSKLGLKANWVRYDTRRLGGADRYEVAASVSRTIQPNARTLVLASGEPHAFFDGTVAGPLASTVGGPILLTKAGALPVATSKEIQRRTALREVLVVGGPASVSDAVVGQLRARGLTVRRLAGPDRYTTAEAVAEEIGRRRSVSTVVVASGTAISDALAASGPAAALYHPIVLVNTNGVPAATRRALDGLSPNAANIVGGPASVTPSTETWLRNRGLTVRRLGGADRYEVSANIATYYRTSFARPSEIVVTSGSDLAMADSLSAGAMKQLMVLTPPKSAHPRARYVVTTTGVLEQITVVGGPASVSESARFQLRDS